MKKLLVGAAVVIAAVASQAASVSWQSVNTGGTASTYLVDAENTSTKLTAVPNADKGAAIVLIKLAAADLTSYSAGTWKSASATVLSTATVGSGKGAGKVTGTYSFNYAEKVISDGDYLAAVLKADDGKYYQLEYANGGAVTDYMTVAGMATAEGKGEQALWSQSYNFATGGNFTAVPEPTSGLLFLLGMAGLALRRKKA